MTSKADSETNRTTGAAGTETAGTEGQDSGAKVQDALADPGGTAAFPDGISPAEALRDAPAQEGEVLASVAASGIRRVMGVGMLTGLSLLTFYVALARPPSAGWLVFLLAVSAGSIWAAYRMWQATAFVVELTETELRCSDGTLIALVSDLEGIDRGFFAFKPSNGFLLRRKTAGSRCWYPGLWWRAGRRIGIGGVTPGSHSKAMSEIIAALMAARQS